MIHFNYWMILLFAILLLIGYGIGYSVGHNNGYNMAKSRRFRFVCDTCGSNDYPNDIDDMMLACPECGNYTYEVKEAR